MAVEVGPEIEQLVFEICRRPEQDVIQILAPNGAVLFQQGDMETISQAGTTAPAEVATITSSPSGASITAIGSGCIPGTYTTQRI